MSHVDNMERNWVEFR